MQRNWKMKPRYDMGIRISRQDHQNKQTKKLSEFEDIVI